MCMRRNRSAYLQNDLQAASQNVHQAPSLRTHQSIRIAQHATTSSFRTIIPHYIPGSRFLFDFILSDNASHRTMTQSSDIALSSPKIQNWNSCKLHLLFLNNMHKYTRPTNTCTYYYYTCGIRAWHAWSLHHAYASESLLSSSTFKITISMQLWNTCACRTSSMCICFRGVAGFYARAHHFYLFSTSSYSIQLVFRCMLNQIYIMNECFMPLFPFRTYWSTRRLSSSCSVTRLHSRLTHKLTHWMHTENTN